MLCAPDDVTSRAPEKSPLLEAHISPSTQNLPNFWDYVGVSEMQTSLLPDSVKEFIPPFPFLLEAPPDVRSGLQHPALL